MVSQMDREEEGESREGRERRVEKTERRLSGEKVERILESCKKTTALLTFCLFGGNWLFLLAGSVVIDGEQQEKLENHYTIRG